MNHKGLFVKWVGTDSLRRENADNKKCEGRK